MKIMNRMNHLKNSKYIIYIHKFICINLYEYKYNATMDTEKKFILFIFIILIFIIYIFKQGDSSSIILISILSALLLGYLFKSEKFSEFFTPTNNVFSEKLDDSETRSNINTDDFEINKYGNISTSEDIDMTKQELSKMDFGLFDKSNNKGPNNIDNSDVIEMAITRGTTLFQPNGGGFSPLKGIVDVPNKFSEYDIPLSGKQNVDEMMSRKQQQRASMNKRALDGSVRATRDLYCKYFQEELDENEHRVWYSSEAQDMETDWTPY